MMMAKKMKKKKKKRRRRRSRRSKGQEREGRKEERKNGHSSGGGSGGGEGKDVEKSKKEGRAGSPHIKKRTREEEKGKEIYCYSYYHTLSSPHLFLYYLFPAKDTFGL